VSQASHEQQNLRARSPGAPPSRLLTFRTRRVVGSTLTGLATTDKAVGMKKVLIGVALLLAGYVAVNAAYMRAVNRSSVVADEL
jgi:hypothetical protein